MGLYGLVQEVAQKTDARAIVLVVNGTQGRGAIAHQIGGIENTVLQNTQSAKHNVTKVLFHKAPIGNPSANSARDAEVQIREAANPAAVRVVLNRVIT